MRIVHHTSLYCLEKILSSGRFIAVSNSPLNADSGLNCFAIGKAGNMGQRFENTGAMLVCEWYGQVNTVGMNGTGMSFNPILLTVTDDEAELVAQ